jgi:hypothetical protein
MSGKFLVRWIVLLMPAICVVWLISCSKPTEEAATTTAVIPTQTVEPISAVPATTGTATPLPPTPSQTSHIPAQTPTLTVNPEISTQIATLDLSNMQVQTSTSLSPDGNWGARITVALPFDKNGVNTGNSYYEKLKIIGQYQSVEWTVVDRWAEYKKGYTIPLILQWSSDGLYLYIADFELPSACEKYGFTRNIRRMDLSNGSLKLVAPDLEGSLSLSPDERWLVAVKDDACVAAFHQTANHVAAHATQSDHA